MSLFFCIQANSNLLWHIKFLACIYNIKKQWSYKPGSVHGNSMHKALFPAACHLSTTGVTTSLYRSTLRLGRTTLSSPQNCKNFAGIRELSTSGVHSTHVAIRLVGSCSTFSPLPTKACGRLFSSALTSHH